MPHDRRHPRWQTVGRFRIVEVARVELALLCRIGWCELRYRRRSAGGTSSTAADGRRLPDTGQVWQLREGRPVSGGGRLRLRFLCSHGDRHSRDQQQNDAGGVLHRGRSPRSVRFGESVSRVRHREGAVGRHGRRDRVPLVCGSLLQVGDHVRRGVVRGVRIEQ